MKELTVYSVITTYADYTDDWDNIFSTEESAIRYAKRLILQDSIILVVVNQDSVTELGRRWKKTVYREVK